MFSLFHRLSEWHIHRNIKKKKNRTKVHYCNIGEKWIKITGWYICRGKNFQKKLNRDGSRLIVTKRKMFCSTESVLFESYPYKSYMKSFEILPSRSKRHFEWTNANKSIEMWHLPFSCMCSIVFVALFHFKSSVTSNRLGWAWIWCKI